MNISEIVKDWGGFERLVAALHETGDVTVEHNVQLIGKSGASRQIDVLLRHRQGLYQHIVVVECKYWNTSVERLHIDALATTVREVGAAKGVIFSTKGFQAGAVTQAAHDNIDLFKVRELADEEWGRPGKVVDIFLQVIGVSIGSPQLPGAFSFKGAEPSSGKLTLAMGKPGVDSRTPMFKDGEPEIILEEYLSRIARESAMKFYSPQVIVAQDGNHKVKWLAKQRVHVAPQLPIRIEVNGGILMIPRIEFDCGISIDQSRITVDRSSNYVFALAVEDCVRKKAMYATRKSAEATTVFEDILKPNHQCDDDVLKNGSLITIWAKGFVPFDQFVELKHGELVEASGQ